MYFLPLFIVYIIYTIFTEYFIIYKFIKCPLCNLLPFSI